MLAALNRGRPISTQLLSLGSGEGSTMCTFDMSTFSQDDASVWLVPATLVMILRATMYNIDLERFLECGANREISAGFRARASRVAISGFTINRHHQPIRLVHVKSVNSLRRIRRRLQSQNGFNSWRVFCSVQTIMNRLVTKCNGICQENIRIEVVLLAQKARMICRFWLTSVIANGLFVARVSMLPLSIGYHALQSVRNLHI